MKPIYEKIPQPLEKSFTARIIEREQRPLLNQAWHFHPEIEICYTAKSWGKRFVGNSISDYKEEDLVIFGANLPHGFTTDHYCWQIVLQFKHDFMGNSFISSPELAHVRKMLEHSRRGLVIHGKTKKKAIPIIKKISKANGFKQIMHLFELLDYLASSKEHSELCSEEYALTLNEFNLKRVKIVYDYIIENYKKEVKVKEVAELLSLTEAAFYKFIKKHTKKTFTQIINEFRINHACKLLISTDKTVAEVGYESGYNNISYFNRKFKSVMNTSPKAFKIAYSDTKG